MSYTGAYTFCQKSTRLRLCYHYLMIYKTVRSNGIVYCVFTCASKTSHTYVLGNSIWARVRALNVSRKTNNGLESVMGYMTRNSYWYESLWVNFCWQSEFLLKKWIFVEKVNFCWKSEFLLKKWIFVKKVNFCWKSDFLLKKCWKCEFLFKKWIYFVEFFLKKWIFVEKVKVCWAAGIIVM